MSEGTYVKVQNNPDVKMTLITRNRNFTIKVIREEYSGYNVIVDTPIVFNSSCTVGDSLCIVRDLNYSKINDVEYFLKQRNNVTLKLFYIRILTIVYINVSCQQTDYTVYANIIHYRQY